MDLKLLYNFFHKRGEDTPVLGEDSQILADQIHGRWYNLAKKGRVFSQAVTPLGLAIPIYTATSIPGLVIWNPGDSGVNVELLEYGLAYASGTAAYTAVGLMVREDNVGSNLATGAEITAFSETEPVNALVGAGQASKVRSANSATVTISAGVAAEWIRTLAGLNLEAQTGTAHGTLATPHLFDGQPILPPGTLAWFAATLASVALYAQHVVWNEADV